MRLDLNKLESFPIEIPADAFSLPTGGATLIRGTLFHRGEADTSPFSAMMPSTYAADTYCVEGRIHPTDPAAPDIWFEAGLPLEWNGTLVQRGGAGVDGFVSPTSMPFHGEVRDGENSVLGRGCAILSCDGGHEFINGNLFDCIWLENRECFENFAHQSLKKSLDAMHWLLKKAYDCAPEKVYFYGGSNGGRECMKAIQEYPESYDGAICFFPVLYWIQKLLIDGRNAAFWESGRQSPDKETMARLRAIVLEENESLEKGLIEDWERAEGCAEAVRERLTRELTPQQAELLEQFARPMELPFALAYGSHVMPGYQVYEGVNITPHIEGFAQAQTMGISDLSETILSIVIAQDVHTRITGTELGRWEERFREISGWMDAWNPDLDAFRRRGGKLILVQGTEDARVSARGTVQYYESLRKRYGDGLDDFVKFYMIPGYGHGMDGSPSSYQASADFIGAMEDWVRRGDAPAELESTDILPETLGREMTLRTYPEMATLKAIGE